VKQAAGAGATSSRPGAKVQVCMCRQHQHHVVQATTKQLGTLFPRPATVLLCSLCTGHNVELLWLQGRRHWVRGHCSARQSSCTASGSSPSKRSMLLLKACPQGAVGGLQVFSTGHCRLVVEELQHANSVAGRA
jgi:hypothetical protein